MHEQVIAKQIITEANRHGNVKGITVEVGDLGHLPIEEMESILKAMTNWEITMVKKKATVKCNSCGIIGRPRILEKGHDHNVFECFECGNKMPEIVDGKDIILKEVETE